MGRIGLGKGPDRAGESGMGVGGGVGRPAMPWAGGSEASDAEGVRSSGEAGERGRTPRDRMLELLERMEDWAEDSAHGEGAAGAESDPEEE